MSKIQRDSQYKMVDKTQLPLLVAVCYEHKWYHMPETTANAPTLQQTQLEKTQRTTTSAKSALTKSHQITNTDTSLSNLLCSLYDTLLLNQEAILKNMMSPVSDFGNTGFCCNVGPTIFQKHSTSIWCEIEWIFVPFDVWQDLVSTMGGHDFWRGGNSSSFQGLLSMVPFSRSITSVYCII